MGDGVSDPAQELIDLVGEIAAAGERARLYKRDCSQLVRRLKLLLPLLEELRDLPGAGAAEEAFHGLVAACLKAKQLVSLCQAGPKVYLVLAVDSIGEKFVEIAQDLAEALDVLPLENLEVSDEACEQVQLVHSQLKRAKVLANVYESKLRDEILALLSRSPDEELDQASLRRLADSLHLKTLSDLRKESQAFQRLRGEVDSSDDNNKVDKLLRLLKTIAAQEKPRLEAPASELTRLSLGAVDKSTSPPVPPDFRCPISLDLMKDPVIVATGQTYDRVSIQKWLDAGRKTCPKTQQVLPHLVLTPNYVLRSLIAQWCEAHGVDPPEGVGAGRGSKLSSSVELSPAERASIEILMKKLSSDQTEIQRAAAGEIRLLAKKSSENRVCIAEAGAIPFLVNLLATRDQKTQEHAVTALLNLSINDGNKAPIVMLGAIDPIVEVLKSGSMEARENAAATLFSLSVVDENKVTIGASDAIPALVELLREGSSRGKKDALTALFNLSIYQGNKPRAVRAGVVALLMDLLVDQSMGMVDESLAILAILATHQEGRVVIGDAGAVPVLVELIRGGSSRNKENAAAVLHALSSSDSAHLVAAEQLGVEEALVDLAQSGSARARRKANSLLENLRHHRQQQLVSFSDCCT